jgi:hypothetical protein
MPKYASDGSINITVVSGDVFTGVMASDGSLNVVVADGTYLGLYHPCGAIQVTAVDGDTFVGFYAVDGSMNVFEGTSRACGATPVTVVSGSLASSLAAVLAAGEAEALALVFNDSAFYEETGHYGSAWVLDTTTPANDYDSHPYGLLTYTSPSPKMLMQADGELKFGAHNLALQSEACATSPWTGSNANWTATNNATTTPDGLNAASIVAASGKTMNAGMEYSQFLGSIIGPRLCLEFDIKSSDFTTIAVQNGGGKGVAITMATGAVSSLGAATVNSTSLGGGWHRVSYEWDTTGNEYFYLYPTAGGTTVGGETLYLSRVHLRRVPAVDTYLKTTTTARYALPIEFSSDGTESWLTVESAATNLLLHSNLLSSTWTNSSATIAQDATGIDGLQSAWTVTDNSGAATQFVFQSVSISAAAHVFSVWVNKTSGATTFPSLSVFGPNGSRRAGCTIDTNAGTATAWASFTGSTMLTQSVTTEDFGDAFRVKLTFTAANAEAHFFSLVPAAHSSVSATGDFDVTVQGSAIFERVQLEVGSAASSYIPTFASTVTRAADNIRLAVTAFPYDATDFMWYAKVYMPQVSTNGRLIGASTATAPIFMSATPTYIGSWNGAQQLLYERPNTHVGKTTKNAMTVGTGVRRLVADGGTPASDANGQGTITQLVIGSNNGSGDFSCGRIYEILAVPREYSAAELQTLTGA